MILTHLSCNHLCIGVKTAYFDVSFKLARQQWYEISGTKGTIRCHNFINAKDPATAQHYYHVDWNSKESRLEAEIADDIHPQYDVPMLQKFGSLLVAHTQGTRKEESDYWPQLSLLTQRIVDALYRSALSNQPVTDI